MHGGAPGPGLAPSSSVLSSCSTNWKVVPTPAPSQLQSTGLEMLLELPGMKLDPENSREQELGNHGQEQREQAGLGSADPRRGERDRICIGFNWAKTLCKLRVRKKGLAIAGVRQEWGSARACSGLVSTAGRG